MELQEVLKDTEDPGMLQSMKGHKQDTTWPMNNSNGSNVLKKKALRVLMLHRLRAYYGRTVLI